MYEKVRSKMKTGDLIAFSGKSRISNLIKFGTKSDISHVGMVFEKSVQGEPRVEIIESTSLLRNPDSRSGQLVKGVQYQKLSQRIDMYDGQIYWQPLNLKINEAKQARMLSWLHSKWSATTKYDTRGAFNSWYDAPQALGWLWGKITGRKYTMSGINILGLEREPDFNTLFCSEMVAEAYRLAGLLPKDYNASEATPADVVAYDFLGERVQIS